MRQVSERFYLDPRNKERFAALHDLLRTLESTDVQAGERAVLRWSRTFNNLLQSGELQTIIGEILTEMSVSMAFQPGWISNRAEEWFIADSPNFSLRAYVVRPPMNDVLFSLSQDCLIGNLGQSPVHFQRHAFPAGLRRDVFDRNLILSEGSRETIAPLQSTTLACASDIPEYIIPAATVLVQLSPKVYAPLVWVFDRPTRSALMCSSSYEAPVRNQAVAEALQYLAMESSAPVEPFLTALNQLATNPHHYVRWRALQSLCAIDFDFAKPYLLKACEDEHPTVAHAARKAAQRLAIA